MYSRGKRLNLFGRFKPSFGLIFKLSLFPIVLSALSHASDQSCLTKLSNVTRPKDSINEVVAQSGTPQHQSAFKHLESIISTSSSNHLAMDPPLIAAALSLTEPERQILISRTHQMRADSSRNTIQLILYDPTTWKRFLHRIAKKGFWGREIYTTLIPLLENMPAPLKALLQKRAAQKYPHLVKKGGVIKRAGLDYMEGKRAMATFLRFSLNPNGVIQNAIDEGLTPIEAYHRWHNGLDSLFQTSMPNRPTSVQILKVLSTIQTIVRETDLAVRGGSPILTLYGSFPMGLANRNSDIDVFSSDSSMKALFPEIQNRISSQITNSNHKIQHAPDFFNPVYGAIISPIMFRISPEKIELLLYPKTNESYRYKDLGLKNDPEPIILTLVDDVASSSTSPPKLKLNGQVNNEIIDATAVSYHQFTEPISADSSQRSSKVFGSPSDLIISFDTGGGSVLTTLNDSNLWSRWAFYGIKRGKHDRIYKDIIFRFPKIPESARESLQKHFNESASNPRSLTCASGMCHAVETVGELKIGDRAGTGFLLHSTALRLLKHGLLDKTGKRIPMEIYTGNGKTLSETLKDLKERENYHLKRWAFVRAPGAATIASGSAWVLQWLLNQ